MSRTKYEPDLDAIEPDIIGRAYKYLIPTQKESGTTPTNRPGVNSHILSISLLDRFHNTERRRFSFGHQEAVIYH